VNQGAVEAGSVLFTEPRAGIGGVLQAGQSLLKSAQALFAKGSIRWVIATAVGAEH
jgi:hypothetical protein